MLQDMDHMEASRVFYVKVRTFDQLEQSKISVLTVISVGIVTLIVRYDIIVSICFMYDPGYVLRQTSPDDLSAAEFRFYIYQTRDISCRSLRCIPAHKQTYKHHRTDLLQFAGRLDSLPTCSDTQQDVSWVERASWQSFIPLWPVDYYIFLRTFHFSLSSSSPFPQQQDMAPQTPQPGGIQSESSRTAGASSNAHLAETQLQRRHQLVHRDAAIAATENMGPDAHLSKARNTGRSNNRQQHAIGCE